MAITEPNHVWATDITYIPMEHGFELCGKVGDDDVRKAA
jgi:hypothetical protein